MQACGIIVEYNPFHYGHQYHVKQAKEQTDATCVIACMSGNFLQRGEPAIVDKFMRARMAIDQGVDIVIELPYASAVQHSDNFASGAIALLNELKVSSICFGSEQGNIDSFHQAYQILEENKIEFNAIIKNELSLGKSYPVANNRAFQKIGLTTNTNGLDLSKPNNILGFSYVKSIHKINPLIKAITIKRVQSDYHDQVIKHPYASATSIRKGLLDRHDISDDVSQSLPESTQQYLTAYKEQTGIWHTWEAYFSFLQYRVATMSLEALQMIQGVDEGMEYRLKKTVHEVTSFKQWLTALHTKRFTNTRIQRMFVHILTHTTKNEIKQIQFEQSIPYIRLLGMSEQGKIHLNNTKKERLVPIVTQLSRNLSQMLALDERASDAYYTVLPATMRNQMRKQEFNPPYMK
ncbi:MULTISPECIES: nucleotidyltransferase [Paraliobacillus]|uniref:nucleotidyltransferase n=1 Tax=Paraliobacillus TaxID=200903 RepID=UPI000DD30F63|nr:MULTISPECIES: nucleotidyltransferase [Paraliobacillus]